MAGAASAPAMPTRIALRRAGDDSASRKRFLDAIDRVSPSIADTSGMQGSQSACQASGQSTMRWQQGHPPDSAIEPGGFWQHAPHVETFSRGETMSTLTISMPGKPLRIGRLLAGLTLWVGALCAIAVLLAGPAYRAEWLPLGAALQTVRWAATVAIGGTVVALVALLLLIAQRSPPQLRLWAAAALVLNAVVAGPPLLMYSRLQQLPRIHDITTNLDKPPTFEALVPLRKAAKNPVTYVPSVAAEQRKGYPDIQPLTLPLAPPAAFDPAAEAARAMGWDLVAAAAHQGAPEAPRPPP